MGTCGVTRPNSVSTVSASQASRLVETLGRDIPEDLVPRAPLTRGAGAQSTVKRLSDALMRAQATHTEG